MRELRENAVRFQRAASPADRTSAARGSDPVRTERPAGAHVDEDGVLTDAEDRAGVERLDVLLAQRAAVVEKLAPLWAEYGPGGMGDHRLSAERARIIGLLRAMAVANEQKVTEAALESGSRAHPDYLGLMARMTTERAEFFKLTETLQNIDHRLYRGQALLRAYSSEIRT